MNNIIPQIIILDSEVCKMNNDISTEISILETEVCKMETIPTEISILDNEIREMDNISTEISISESEVPKLDNISTEMDILDNEIRKMDNINTEISSSDSEVLKLDNISTEIDILDTKVGKMDDIPTQISILESKLRKIYDDMDSLKIKIKKLNVHVEVFEASRLAQTPTFKREIATLKSRIQDVEQQSGILREQKQDLKLKIYELEYDEIFQAHVKNLEANQYIVVPNFLLGLAERHGYRIVADNIKITISAFGIKYNKDGPIKYDVFYVSKVNFSDNFVNDCGNTSPNISDIYPLMKHIPESKSIESCIYYVDNDTIIFVDYWLLNKIYINRIYHKKKLADNPEHTIQLNMENSYTEMGLLVGK